MSEVESPERSEKTKSSRRNRDNPNLHQAANPIVRERVISDLEEAACECVQVDVDEWDARFCPEHGPNSMALRQQNEREAAELVAYYSGPDISTSH